MLQNGPAVSIASLVARMPRPDPQEQILKNVEEGQVEAIVAELLAGGRETLAALLDTLVDPASGKSDSQARHALHALIIHAGGLGDEQRRALADALADELKREDRPENVRAFLLQELRWCGGPPAAKAAGQLLLHPRLYQDAAMALLAIRDGATEQFRAALTAVTVAPQRAACVTGLGVLRDRGSVDVLKQAAAENDPGVRAAAQWALAAITGAESSR